LLKWFGSYLSHRYQRVKVGQLFFSWKTLCGGMPQGSRLGPLSFIVLIDDLRAVYELHKFVDSTILSKLIQSTDSASKMTHTLPLDSPGQPITICKLLYLKPKK